MLEHITKTYATSKKPRPKSRNAEPSEEEFEAARARIEARRAAQPSGSGGKRDGAQPPHNSNIKGKKARR
jgi:hypothetical protein